MGYTSNNLLFRFIVIIFVQLLDVNLLFQINFFYDHEQIHDITVSS